MTSATDSPVGPRDLPAEPPEATAGAADRSGQAAAKVAETEHRQQPRSEAFKRFVASGWGAARRRRPGAVTRRTASPASGASGCRRQFPGERLVIPAGGAAAAQQRHRLPVPPALGVRPPDRPGHRPGAGRRAGARAAGRRDGGGHEAVLYFRPRAGRDTEEFYADARYGELWVGVRPVPGGDRGAEPGSTRRHIDELTDAHHQGRGEGGTRPDRARAPTPASTALVDEARALAGRRRRARPTPSWPRR